MKRRAVLLALGVVAGYFGWSRYPKSLPETMRAQIADAFGKTIANAPETSAFLEDYLHYLASTPGHEYKRIAVYFHQAPDKPPSELETADYLREHMFGAYLRATNVIRATERGEPLEYTGIFDPRTNPCANQLSAQL